MAGKQLLASEDDENGKSSHGDPSALMTAFGKRTKELDINRFLCHSALLSLI